MTINTKNNTAWILPHAFARIAIHHSIPSTNSRIVNSHPHLIFPYRRVHPACTALRMATSLSSDSAKAVFPISTKSPEEKKQAEDALAAYFGKSASRDQIVWYLKDRKYDEDEAIEKLQKRLDWERDMADPNLIDQATVDAELLVKKSFFYPKRDKLGREVVMVRACKHVIGEFPHDSSRKAIKKVMDDAVNKLTEPDRQTLLCVVDLRGFSVRNADFKLALFLIDVFFVYYPRRLGRLLFVDAPIVFIPTWNAVKPLIGKYAELVTFVKASQVKDYFNPGDVPPDFA
eukprot:CAMPEP_0184694926 /NCGR_PEP_ID=MMETSP0313-20130426/2724_1 /TAXON_ID=2792 /ORGANISM="Porphyridium aerugineum, Strain SAG 1380-2" /LENGTH=287 /DNA_ID=CAMNT_0027153291 /DNA_START=315 /DNA_END=1178 /DNA_ORIENTATION=+